jgi:hypothetical protein
MIAAAGHPTILDSRHWQSQHDDAEAAADEVRAA